VVDGQKEQARAQKELSVAIQGWMKLFTANAGGAAQASWVNTDTAEWVREQAAARGKSDQVPVGASDAELVSWLEKEMESAE
jgi:hypothetical protein